MTKVLSVHRTPPLLAANMHCILLALYKSPSKWKKTEKEDSSNSKAARTMMQFLSTPAVWSCFTILLFISCFAWTSQALKIKSRPDTYHYHVLDSTENVLFKGGDIAFFVGGQWCVHKVTPATNHEPKHRILVPEGRQVISGKDSVLGEYVGERVFWTCRLDSGDMPGNNTETNDNAQGQLLEVNTAYKNMKSETAVLFEVEWPGGAPQTQVISDYKSAMTNYPSLRYSTRYLPDAFSWQGGFSQSVRGFSEGTVGGPTVFYDASDPTLEYVLVGSPWNGNWKSFSAGNNHDWKGEPIYWTPGTSGRIQQLPRHFKQSILLFQRNGGQHPGGITATIDAWGRLMRRQAHKSNNSSGPVKVADVTLEKIGYQTDNGAMYCFCSERNCSQTLLEEIDSLSKQGLPMGYLSFQGAGASSGRGEAAPWCVDTWGVDGGLSDKYPMDLDSFHKALKIPLQLYAPYFCPSSPYFDPTKQDNPKWASVASDPTLPGCSNFSFENVHPSQSRDFYNWFLDKGIRHAGMGSFESDFMAENYNCIPDFIHNATAAETWQKGMAGAALAKSIPIQWCIATPTDVLASLDLPAVTNFRVSNDFCYGTSWNIGESSLLVWAVGAAPSKDTLWSTDNNKTEIPGCPWTTDHEASAAELHVVLALMSTGPVGISDAIGNTNATLLKRIISKDGTLLKPIKPITAVDSTFLQVEEHEDEKVATLASGDASVTGGGYVYGTAGVGPSWIFVSFLMPPYPYRVKIRDFWPSLPRSGGFQPVTLAYRHFNGGMGCQNGQDAMASGCVKIVTLFIADKHVNHTVLDIPNAGSISSGTASFVPSVTMVWKSCQGSGWILLGELDKYVPLSPKRFHKVVCTKQGVSVNVNGTHGETIELTALQPENDIVPGYNKARYKVVTKTAAFTESGETSILFEEPEEERNIYVMKK